MVFQIESSTYCPSGLAPRWTWWVKGVQGSTRYGVLGTNEQGTGLYLYRFEGDRAPIREELIACHSFMVTTSSRADAQAQLATAVRQLGWAIQPPPASHLAHASL